MQRRCCWQGWEDEAVGRVGEGLAREACNGSWRGYPLFIYNIYKVFYKSLDIVGKIISWVKANIVEYGPKVNYSRLSVYMCFTIRNALLKTIYFSEIKLCQPSWLGRKAVGPEIATNYSFAIYLFI